MSDYVPTEEDLIHNRTKTTGIHEYDFVAKDIPFHLIDVGGQRSERKKWVSFFSEVDCAIFITSLAEYDMKLYEDSNTSRLTESVAVFKDIMTGKLYTHQQTIGCEYDYTTIFELEPFDQSNITRYLHISNKAFFPSSDIISDKSLSIHNNINKALEEINSPFRKLDYDMLVVKENGAGRCISFVK